MIRTKIKDRARTLLSGSRVPMEQNNLRKQKTRKPGTEGL